MMTANDKLMASAEEERESLHRMTSGGRGRERTKSGRGENVEGKKSIEIGNGGQA